MSGAPVFMSGALVFVTSAQGITVDHLALVAMGTWFPGSHRTVTKRQLLAGYHTPATAQTAD